MTNRNKIFQQFMLLRHKHFHKHENMRIYNKSFEICITLHPFVWCQTNFITHYSIPNPNLFFTIYTIFSYNIDFNQFLKTQKI